MEYAETTPTFFARYQYCADSELYDATGKQLYIQTLFNYTYTPLVIGGTDKNKQLTIAKPMQTGINRNK
jgi:hypothetical protein